MKEIYICTVGERGEGYGIRKVYSTLPLALKWLENQHADSDETVTPIVQVTPGLFQFSIYCDIYSVRTWGVD